MKRIISIIIALTMALSMMPLSVMATDAGVADEYNEIESVAQSLIGAEINGLKSVIYTGNPIEPEFEVVLGETTLEEGKDYEVVYRNNIEIGIATVEINGIGNYTGTITRTFNIIGIPIANKVDLEFKNWNFVSYNDLHDFVEDNLIITLDGKVLQRDEDYRVHTVSANREDKKITRFELSFEGMYSGGIIMRCLDYAYAGTIPDQYYTGNAIIPDIDIYESELEYISAFGKPLTKDEDYTVKYSNNIEPGIATMKILPLRNTYGYTEFNFRICKDISKADIKGISDVEYKGRAETPEITVIDEGNTLEEGVDYEVTYRNNTDAGTAEVVVKGIGVYGGEIIKTFNIAQKCVTDNAEYILDNWSFSSSLWEKEYLKENLKVIVDGRTLLHDVDYKINRTNVLLGNTENTILWYELEFIGNYSGRKMCNNLVPLYIAPVDAQLYTGKEVKPEISIYYDRMYGFKIVENKDYTVEFINNIEAGVATAKITGIGDYIGTREITFQIVKDISDTIVKGIPDVEYTGEEITPDVKVVYNDDVLKEGEDYTVSYSNNIDVGTATIEVQGIGDFTGNIIKTFEIVPRKISFDEVTIQQIPDQHLTGNEIRPEMKDRVTDSYGNVLVEDADYIVEYMNNIEAGTAIVRLTATGNYFGTTETTFTITDHEYDWVVNTQAAMQSDGEKQLSCVLCGFEKAESKMVIPSVRSVTASKKTYTYNGKVQIPNIIITDREGNAVSRDNYTTEYLTDNIAVGRHDILVKFKGDYRGTWQLPYIIVPKAPAGASVNLATTTTPTSGRYNDVKFSWKKVQGATGYKVYYKKAAAKNYTFMKNVTGTTVIKKDLANGTKYTFKVIPYYREAGKDYFDSKQGKTASVITLKKIAGVKVRKNGSRVKVQWKNINGETGYQISRSAKKTGTNIVATYKTTTGKSKLVKAAKGKTYYYKVRAYKVVNGKKVFGPWSTAQKFKRK